MKKIALVISVLFISIFVIFKNYYKYDNVNSFFNNEINYKKISKTKDKIVIVDVEMFKYFSVESIEIININESEQKLIFNELLYEPTDLPYLRINRLAISPVDINSQTKNFTDILIEDKPVFIINDLSIEDKNTYISVTYIETKGSKIFSKPEEQTEGSPSNFLISIKADTDLILKAKDLRIKQGNDLVEFYNIDMLNDPALEIFHMNIDSNLFQLTSSYNEYGKIDYIDNGLIHFLKSKKIDNDNDTTLIYYIKLFYTTITPFIKNNSDIFFTLTGDNVKTVQYIDEKFIINNEYEINVEFIE